MFNRITAFSKHDVGSSRDRLEDHATNEQLITPGGLRLQIAMVCDGIGSNLFGQQAAQEAATVIRDYMSNSSEQDVPTLLREATRAANRRIYNMLHGRGNTTLALVAINLDENPPFGKLYLASAGDSLIFLIRNERLIRLNTDHTVANERRMGGASSAEIASLERGNALTRAVGMGQAFEPDLSRYVQVEANGTSRQVGPAEAAQMGEAGLMLQDGDTIMLSSDGLREINPDDGRPYLRDDEIIQHALDPDVNSAVDAMMDYALQRRPFDNIAMSLLFIPSPSGKRGGVPEPPPVAATGAGPAPAQPAQAVVRRRGLSQRQLFLLTAFLFVLVVGAAGVLASLTGGPGGVTTIDPETIELVNQQSTELAELAVVATSARETAVAEIAAFTPTPLPTNTPPATLTPTSTPLLVAQAPDQVGGRFRQDTQLGPVQRGQEVAALDEASYWQFFSQDAPQGLDSAVVYVVEETSLRANDVQFVGDPGPSTILDLFQDGGLFVEVRGFSGGVQIQLDVFPDVLIRSDRGCLAARYETPDEVSMACYANAVNGCDYRLSSEFADGGNLLSGQRVLVDLEDPENIRGSDPQPISLEESRIYWNTIAEAFGTGGRLAFERVPPCLRDLGDTDGDFVFDADEPEICRGIPGLPEFNGCPDSDGDGVPLDRDQCPNERGDQANGCPVDSDGDGIPNREDQCPSAPGPASNNGCPLAPTAAPDSDGDGLPDNIDRCPNEPGPSDNAGCPIQSN